MEGLTHTKYLPKRAQCSYLEQGANYVLVLTVTVLCLQLFILLKAKASKDSMFLFKNQVKVKSCRELLKKKLSVQMLPLPCGCSTAITQMDFNPNTPLAWAAFNPYNDLQPRRDEPMQPKDTRLRS